MISKIKLYTPRGSIMVTRVSVNVKGPANQKEEYNKEIKKAKELLLYSLVEEE